MAFWGGEKGGGAKPPTTRMIGGLSRVLSNDEGKHLGETAWGATFLLITHTPTCTPFPPHAMSNDAWSWPDDDDVTVAVTGATGYLAAHVVRVLLEKGCKVHGTVRDMGEEGRYWPLQCLPNAPKNLRLYEAELDDEDAFFTAFLGCDAVVHLASPFFTRVADDADAEERLIKPAVEGTQNVLRACKRTGIKRVVLTSSIAAMYRQRPDASFANGVPPAITDDTWSDVDFMRETKQWYPLSKTLAEKAAMEFAEAEQLDVRVCNPSLVLGPAITPHLNESLKSVKVLVDGKRKELKNYILGVVDVRDAAEAHYLLLAREEAKGRHLCLGQFVDFLKVRDEVAEIVGFSRFTAAVTGGPKDVPSFNVSKLNKLGMKYRPLTECLEDCLQGLVNHGHLR